MYEHYIEEMLNEMKFGDSEHVFYKIYKAWKSQKYDFLLTPEDRQQFINDLERRFIKWQLNQ